MGLSDVDFGRQPTAASRHFGHYRLLGMLSRSGVGASYVGMVASTGELRHLVVVEESRRDGANADLVRQFVAEAKHAARFDHPNVVRTLESGRVGDSYYVATEYLEGQPASHLVQASRVEPRVPLRLRLQVLRDALSGLHHAHELRAEDGRSSNFVHGDMCPANLMITYDGQVKVTGFGLARATLFGAERGGFRGNPRYVAPEQVLGETLDRRVDVFSVGVMLWEAISLYRFASNSLNDRVALKRRVAGAEPRIAQVCPHVPPRLAMICDKAMSVNPKDRFRSAEAFRDALDDYMSTSGATFKSAAIGHLMGRKFGAERAALREVIERQARNGEEVATSIERKRQVTVVEEDPTESFALTEHSRLIESRRAPEAGNDRAAPRTRHYGFWLTVSLLAALAAAAVLVPPYVPRTVADRLAASGLTPRPDGASGTPRPEPAASTGSGPAISAGSSAPATSSLPPIAAPPPKH